MMTQKSVTKDSNRAIVTLSTHGNAVVVAAKISMGVAGKMWELIPILAMVSHEVVSGFLAEILHNPRTLEISKPCK